MISKFIATEEKHFEEVKNYLNDHNLSDKVSVIAFNVLKSIELKSMKLS
ncbi:MAG: hypothetical protein H0W88_04585 [Parachlamydiaceae bacterium]|nr:hypothetical protein [Parachlamydiaceae bacterium]